jgi:hypothetical protein
MFTEDDLQQALTECFVPSLRRDVVAAALVRSARLQPDPEAPGAGIPGVPPRFTAHITLSAPGADDAVNAQVRAAVENRLLGLPAISQVNLTMLPALFPILGGR